MPTSDNEDGRPTQGGAAAPVHVMNPISVSLTGTIPGTVEVANDSGNPIPVSGTVDTELPAAAALADAAANPTAPTVGADNMVWNGTTWDRLKGDNTGAARVSLYATSSSAGDTAVKAGAYGSVDGLGESSISLITSNLAELFNGGAWDRDRNNHEVTALAAAARTASVNSSDLTNYNARGAIVVVDITALTATGTLTVTIQGKDTLSGKYYTLLASTLLAATGTTVMVVYPGTTIAANLDANSPLPRIWRVSVVAGNGVSITYSVGCNYIN